MGYSIALGARVRKSPYFDRTVEDGAAAFSVYNHMYMPVSYGDPLAEYWRLVEGVSMWDVAAERQVEMAGPDARRLARLLTPRNLEAATAGHGRYVPLCDHRGIVLNDPVLLPLSDARWWLSVADADILLWAQAIAAERGLDVAVAEPDVSPLAVQGPKAVDVVADLLGDWVRSLARFEFRAAALEGIPLLVARSGWSKQGGYELFLRDGTAGGRLWDLVREAGRPHDIGPGGPNYIERIESGLISFRADTDDDTDPYELGLGRFVDCDQAADFIGKAALTRIRDRGPRRRFVGYVFDGDLPANAEHKWPVAQGGEAVGFVSATCFSPRLLATIGLGLVAADLAAEGTTLTCETPHGPREVRVTALPFRI